MKNSIMFYYELEIDDISFDGENYFFEKYILKKLKRPINYEIYNYFINNNFYIYKIINNKFNNYETNIDGEIYVLLLMEKKISIDVSLIISFCKKIDVNYKLNWDSLWQQKIDYFEKLLVSNIFDKHDSSIIQYYIGLSENAIQYYKENKGFYSLNFSHYRMNRDSDFFSPDNILIDNISRDIAEYIKYLFFYKENKEEKLNDLVSSLNFTRDEYILFFSRLLFPTYFFDCFELNKNLVSIYSKAVQYEKFLSKILISLKRNVDIPYIEWIIKKA